ncbi:MAG: hypothetical protein PHS79_01230 [Patescibacteria group bacterium]|nr:hypothetical protein [Patescibacteria group bacterium]
MDREMMDVTVKTARDVVAQHRCRIDAYGEHLLRTALLDGQCVQIVIPEDGGNCPMAVKGNLHDNRVWFVRAGSLTEDRGMHERFSAPLRAWVDAHRDK